MLILSRKEDQTIIFPNLGIRVEVVRVKGKNVSIGVDAPESIRVVRGELIDQSDRDQDKANVFKQLDSKLLSLDPVTRHGLRNHLNTASLSVSVAQQQMEIGEHQNAEKFLAQAIEALQELNMVFESPSLRGDQSGQQQSAAEQPDQSSRSRVSKWKALIVEDNDNERELLAGVLEMAGFDVSAVADGVAAIDFLKSHDKPDVVLMDMNMPRLDGRQTVSRIRRELHDNELPIFGVSGLTQSEANIPTGDRGVTGWFSKPVNPHQLVRYLQHEIESHADKVAK